MSVWPGSCATSTAGAGGDEERRARSCDSKPAGAVSRNAGASPNASVMKPSSSATSANERSSAAAATTSNVGALGAGTGVADTRAEMRGFFAEARGGVGAAGSWPGDVALIGIGGVEERCGARALLRCCGGDDARAGFFFGAGAGPAFAAATFPLDGLAAETLPLDDFGAATLPLDDFGAATLPLDDGFIALGARAAIGLFGGAPRPLPSRRSVISRL